MNRRRFVRAMAVAPLLASSAGIAVGAVSHRISPASAEFMATTLPRLLEIAAAPGIGIGLLCKGQLRRRSGKAASLSKQASAYAASRNLVDSYAILDDRWRPCYEHRRAD